ncbi:hypothetical protein BBAD15_g12439 [Beauveria bassiana D1-5]|uniref:Uncharacterized protein n=1 Tax=Beauveria bassiana D1-5 TaxID=1245745 RepID=A0A0A2V7P5_BEABA|nr:hypothetical protein BBAD15_g12439 [Beauveria bassiana D1-5]
MGRNRRSGSGAGGRDRRGLAADPAQQRPDHDPVRNPQQYRDQGRQGAIAREISQNLANAGAVAQQPRAVPDRVDDGRQHVQRNQVIQAAHQQRTGQQQQQDFGHAEKAAPGDELAAQLQQPEGQQRHQETGHAGQRQHQHVAAALARRDGAVQEHHGFAAFAGHRDRHQDEQAPPVIVGHRGTGAAFELALEGAAVLLHPHDHLHHQHARRQRHDRLEPFLTFVAEPRRHAQQHQRQRDCQRQARAHATPQILQSALAFRRRAQPGVQNAHHQHGFDAFAPDDEKNLFHVMRPPIPWA